jgi:hypothetical protein
VSREERSFPYEDGGGGEVQLFVRDIGALPIQQLHGLVSQSVEGRARYENDGQLHWHFETD